VRRKTIPYHLRLPDEYRHSQPSPVLIALHGGGETALDTARRWAEQASDNGYILAAPAWGTGNGDVYGYSSEEHMTVLDVLRDLRKRFNVDSDRVFLTGWGQGGNMAYDVGLAHPDLFAGVVPISAAPNVYGTHYKTNAQLLPFYVVIGDRSGALQN